LAAKRQGKKTSDTFLIYAFDPLHGFLLIDIVKEPNGHLVAMMDTTRSVELMNLYADIAEAFIHSGLVLVSRAKPKTTVPAFSGAPFYLGDSQLLTGWNLMATADNASGTFIPLAWTVRAARRCWTTPPARATLTLPPPASCWARAWGSGSTGPDFF